MCFVMGTANPDREWYFTTVAVQDALPIWGHCVLGAQVARRRPKRPADLQTVDHRLRDRRRDRHRRNRIPFALSLLPSRFVGIVGPHVITGLGGPAARRRQDHRFPLTGPAASWTCARPAAPPEDAGPCGAPVRSEERRVGKGWVSTCRSRWAPEN